MTNTTTRRSRSRRNTKEQSGTAELAGTTSEEYTMVDAQADVASSAQAELAGELERLTADLIRARANVTKARDRLDRAVARAVTSEPLRVNWYDHPGPLSRQAVNRSTGLTPVAISRTMERIRVRAKTRK